MEREECRHCICLVGNHGEWICDELDREISDIKECPERDVRRDRILEEALEE